jgi:purine-binding chemotaxis protein CheW
MSIGPRTTRLDWDAVRERLSCAGIAIALSAQNSDQHDLAAMEKRTRELARVRTGNVPPAGRLELVTFTLAAESYAVETRYVHEIVPVKELTEVPLTPEFLRGVTNLRGEILPVFDLGRLLGLGRPQHEKAPLLIVLGETHPQFGFVADAVEQVTTLEAPVLTSCAGSFGKLGREIVRGVTTNALIILDGLALLADERLINDLLTIEAGDGRGTD